MTVDHMLLWAILGIVVANFILLTVISYLAHRSIKNHGINGILIKKSIDRLIQHEDEEARNWIAFTAGMSDTFQYILKWQKATAKMMYRDAQALTSHDYNVSELLEKAKQISAQLDELTHQWPEYGGKKSDKNSPPF